MKYLYLLITLFILVACGPSEEEAASEPTPPPMNVFEGTYIGDVFGFETSVSITGSSIVIDGEEPCEIEDPYSTPSAYTCVYDDGSEESATIKVEGATLTISPVDFPMEIVFERVSD